MTFSCIQDLTDHLAETHNASDLDLQPELCPADMDGDITVNCFRLARPLKGNPMQIAAGAVEFLLAHADVKAAEAIKAFVNITLTDAALMRDTIADAAALADTALAESDRRAYLVEYSAPNTNKPMHLGHVRNNTLGQAICGLLSKVGHTVSPVNLVNDRGIHICKSMIAYQRFGDGATPETTGKKGDHFVGDYYVKYASEDKRQIEAGETDADGVSEIETADQAMLRDWEAGDPDVRALWQTMNAWVLAGFDETYKRMGITFAHTYYESETYTAGKDIVHQGLENDVFYKRDDGAIEIDLSDLKLDKKVVLRSDGTSVYITQDIGTTLMKANDFTPDGMVWVVGDEQIYHFRVLFAILKRLGYTWADNLHHLAYGMVNLPEGKMKSREGTVVDADNLFDEVAVLANDAILERWPDIDHDELGTRAEAIAMAAVKFMLLKVNPKTTMIFDPKESIRFEGDTGPYLMYAYARISSILEKSGENIDALLSDDAIDWSLLNTAEERAVALRLSGFAETLHVAADNLDPSKVIDYLINLSREFSRFYKEHSVLSAETDALTRARLALCARVRLILRDGLATLTIPTLESM